MRLQRKKIEQLLFNFNIAYSYTFISGIMLALSANIFTTALFMEDRKVPIYWVYGLALSLLVSSMSALIVSMLLEKARNEWQSAGSPNDEIVIREDYIEKGMRRRFLWIFFILILIPLIPIIFYVNFS